VDPQIIGASGAVIASERNGTGTYKKESTIGEWIGPHLVVGYDPLCGENFSLPDLVENLTKTSAGVMIYN
jgi:hypothetical protein